MHESSPTNSPPSPHTPVSVSSSTSDSDSVKALTDHITPPSNKVTGYQSILSDLLKRDNDRKEQAPLLKKKKSKDYLSISNNQNTGVTTNQQPISQQVQQEETRRILSQKDDWFQLTLQELKRNPKTWITKNCIIQPIHYIPAVILGVLLNLLDAISYGMIAFPLNNPIFASFGPDGISMFFVSCIIAQLVYSCGGSVFDGGNGSMMIEVVPFLHIMAEKIISVVGQNNPDVVIPSTMVAFALSSFMTGLAFFLLGALKLGSLIGFFPRHILVGTIGGVGWFLVATGIEVSGRLDENLVYTIPMFKKIFLDTHLFSLWFSAFVVALLLRLIQTRLTSPLVVPVFFMVLPVVFYMIVLGLGLDINQVRDQGWIFPLVESNTPFWHFYGYFKFGLVDWKAVAETLPAMLALTFFGVLHVPINVPALGVSTNKDNVDVNRELVAHGISNAVSGLFGSVQNYLVYTNSLLFIRTGGDSRVAGVMLAAATAILWMIGPWIVGYIPVMVVGSLIFHLGLDLLKEALIDTWHAVHYLEYITICVIILCMAVLGFVEGIFVGIVMACIFFVVQNARRSEAIRATYTGDYMRSTVRRLYRQERFLKRVGTQIQIVKLQGYLFFGTINQVEKTIRDMLDEHAWDHHPIRFLIFDLQLVQGLDFSAAEAFVRIRRLLKARQVYMIICNVAKDEEKALKKAGVWACQSEGDLKCFQNINDAIEWCENELLMIYFEKKPKHLQNLSTMTTTASKPVPKKLYSYSDLPASAGSPRHHIISNAIQHVFKENHTPVVHKNTTQPTLILVQALGEIDHGKTPIEFFHKLSTYFERGTCKKGEALYKEGHSIDYLLILEQGALRSLMYVVTKEEEVIIETILPGTIVGEMGIFSNNSRIVRSRSLVADTDSVFWKLTKKSFERMCQEDPAMANQFMSLALYFSAERMDTITKYAFHLS
ncbi:sulfate transporter family-domain-containing protein [Cokeromyces recurvatus]|uniref:sulfate transporter family-domain-containing protein n=1 Tax=Cokeromyces recurvatus TaxID=90255 RepID=UPI00222097E0|nr:sulfate transporter family-domain-containing protein [Cokeromyces recurvatus]KAI7903690.1 sulfate transporter family-domain-containing protein [Cokeromyces recurvatus]